MRKLLMSRLEARGELTDEEILEIIDDLVLSRSREFLLTLKEKEGLRKDLFYSVRKLDVLQELVEDNTVTEIMVNGYRDIFVERDGIIRKWEKSFTSEERLQDVIQQIAGKCNRVVNEQIPIADARLENGSRVNIVLPPVALDGPIMTIRRFPDDPVTMEKLVSWGSITAEGAGFLRNLVRAGYTILVGGGTSTGKTTFLNALSNFIPKEERIVTIEDNAELQIQGIDNLVRLEAKAANLEENREITIRDLIKTALRMRPSRIIIGEVRSGEAGDFLSCLNTGHSGSLGSAHANSVRDMIGRLEMMVLMGMDLPIPVIRRQIASGVEILVHLTRDKTGRRMVEEIAEITEYAEGEIQIQTLYGRNRQSELVCVSPLRHREKLEKSNEKNQ
ncbi:CpaF family protein [Lachnospiraceae bacterium OF09-33XD]|uniref:CpaF family protein n=2 Tax=Wansuia hejianensis TaxID=2763667 RepID=A0A7G9GI92_9FIRM|nr:ATPase, T2SS/T4P/T4SS family [Wansuia hejianensis]QNM10524.1 CpaF family protein [Wansuia hejianensis]RHV90664.1 CpaF family protein [Lachnospiraceae bacterium OF09-33XD]